MRWHIKVSILIICIELVFLSIPKIKNQFIVPKHTIKLGNLISNKNILKKVVLENAISKQSYRNLEGISISTIAEWIINTAKINHISPFLIFSVIATETNFRYEMKSYTGAIGLMQVEPETAHIISSKYGIYYNTLYNPQVNIEIGTIYLKSLLDRLHSKSRSLSAYNMGITKVIVYHIYSSGYSKSVLSKYHKLKAEYKIFKNEGTI